MLFNNTTFIGIDPTAGERPFTYAALNQEKELLALGEGNIDEVLAFVGGQQAAFVAVCAPRRPNQGVMTRDKVREQLSPSPRPGRWTNFRMVEFQLRQHNITMPRTPTDEDDCPNWMRMGFEVFRRLERMRYHDFPAEDAPHQCLEVYPHASFTVLLGHLPFSKHSLEGRLQRQLVLYEQDINVPYPMHIFEEITHHRLLQGILQLEGLYNPGELDSLVAAYTAWMAATKPDGVSKLGHPEEGNVILPLDILKGRY
ncbi:MAG: DUF429 domain-containing protein [Anaerolineales bacterium]|nr:DUF429 domain-containing protein [Anaerolineales bacterium]